jgi:UDP-GlcNAc:undecaprenyl-phosphate GlcNAc-1-phosphate transferase
MNLNLLFANLISVLIFLILYKNKNFITKKFNLIDYPVKNRKLHKTKIPLIGGLLIFLCFIYLVVINQLFFINTNFLIKIAIILIPIFIIGLLDDLYNLSPTNKIFFLSFLILLFLYFNNEFLLKELYFDEFKKIYLLNNILSLFITTFCLLLLINAFNMSDGINGLAHSISVLWLIILIALFNLSMTFYFITLIIFLSFIFNYQGKYFLGNSGSLFISSFIGILTIYLYNFNLNTKNLLSVEKIVLIFLIPGLDMLRLFILRLSNKKSPFLGDLDHFHHLLISKLHLHKAIIYYLMLIVWPFIFLEFYKIKFFFIFLLQSIMFFFLVSLFKNSKLKIKKSK